MKRDIGLWQLVGFAFTSLLGSLLHFLYGLTGIKATALFSSVNESTWEHMKLLFFPMFLFAIIQRFFIGKNYQGFFCIKLMGTLIGLAFIPITFYTLRGAFGTTPDWINIALFFVSAGAAYIYETKQFKKDGTPCKFEKTAFAFLCIIAAAFIIFTFFPPKIPLFQDPVDGSYGLKIQINSHSNQASGSFPLRVKITDRLHPSFQAYLLPSALNRRALQTALLQTKALQIPFRK